MADNLDILGVRVNRIGMEDTLAFIDTRIAAGGFARIITLNAEIAYSAYLNREILTMINGADLVTPDGHGVLWAAEKMAMPIAEKVSGVDLLLRILALAPEKGWKVYFFGSTEENLAAAVATVREKFPGLALVGFRNGYFREEESAAIAAEIKASGADIVFVGVGAPRQDFWLQAHGRDTGAKVGIGVGGSFDVLSGKVRRAPKLMRNMGLEWFWRLLREPWRYKRMLVLPKYMHLVRRQVKAGRQ